MQGLVGRPGLEPPVGAYDDVPALLAEAEARRDPPDHRAQRAGAVQQLVERRVQVAFGYGFTQNDFVQRWLGPIFLVGLRINNMNFYSGSLALANFSSRILHWVPGRRFWVLITGGVAFVGAMAHVEEHLIKVVAFMGLFCLAWLGVLIADICVLKTKLRIAPTHVEHRRGYLANWRVPSLCSLLVGAVAGATLSLVPIPNATAGPILGDVIAFGIGFAGPILIEALTHGRFRRLARVPDPVWIDDFSHTDEEMESAANMLACGNCGEEVMKQDMVTCPVTETYVLCSVCCAAHRTCGERCKTDVFEPSDADIRRHLQIVATSPDDAPLTSGEPA